MPLRIEDLNKIENYPVKITVSTKGHIPQLNCQGPIYRPVLVNKNTLRSLVVTGFDVTLYKPISTIEKNTNKEVDKGTKTVVKSNVTTETKMEEKKVENKKEIIDSPIKEQEESKNLIYTFEDLKNKSNNDLKKILKDRNVQVNNINRDEMINKVIETNPENK